MMLCIGYPRKTGFFYLMKYEKFESHGKLKELNHGRFTYACMYAFGYCIVLINLQVISRLILLLLAFEYFDNMCTTM